MLRYLSLVGALCGVVAPFLPGGAGRSYAVDRPVIAAAVGLVAVAALGLADARAVRVTAAVGAAAALGVVLRVLVVDLGTGLTGPRLPVLAVGAAAVAVAAWAGRVGGRLGWRARPVGVLAAVLAVAAAVVAPLATRAVVVDSLVRDARAFDAPAVVERPTGGQWSWQPDADVAGLVAAGHGVVVATADGSVVALDGADGREQWRHTRRGARIGTLVASMDRATVVVTFRSLLDTTAQLLVALDADTGAVRFEEVVPSVQAETDGIVPGTRTLALRDGESVVGHDLLTGEERWRWSPPEGCGAPYTPTVRGRTTVFAAVECDDVLRLSALDESTGRERWGHQVDLRPPDGERQDLHLRGTADGSVVWARFATGRARPGAVTDGLFDAEDGTPLARPDPAWVVRAEVGARVLLEEQDSSAVRAIHAFDVATGGTTALDVAACPHRAADATTSTTYLRVCGDTGREVTVLVQGLDGAPPTAVPVRLDGSGSRSALLLTPAPGAIVLTRAAHGGTPAPVVGLTGR
ncbi:PQQ-binding-like beta-propeller repeat protein [Saccharothrix australiensis]|uniref:Putative pyrroloquinoline-quinone binding quinoprotein n=1 Tax=Saccharothrix australiensis TaxID=2072 RepID=A0A495W1K5_9PSEU|nr:PQQ-binding-like beta-propeller repeat protein [Saccharothrix australiensis]RKT54897.1 putative pyrroloquinoline-quinone binding quinoprotein [Saccharothrix australiensis]